MHQKIVILDFGSQYTQLIARRVRESGVFSEIVPCTINMQELIEMNPVGIILSGGPSSVYDENAPRLDPQILSFKRSDGSEMPVLGICYGMMAMCLNEGGDVASADRREFGRAQLIIDNNEDLLAGLPASSTVWMSHGDRVTKLPADYEIIGFERCW